jgi:hypothetical protein
MLKTNKSHHILWYFSFKRPLAVTVSNELTYSISNSYLNENLRFVCYSYLPLTSHSLRYGHGLEHFQISYVISSSASSY